MVRNAMGDPEEQTVYRYRRNRQAECAAALNMMEAVSIAISEPKLNLSRGMWGDAKKYFQFWERDEDEQDEED